MINRSSPESSFGPSFPDGPAPEGFPKDKKKSERAKKNSVPAAEFEPGHLPPDPDKAKRMGGLLVEREPDAIGPRPKKKGKEKRSEPAIEGHLETESTDDETRAAQDSSFIRAEETDLPPSELEAASDVDSDEAEGGDRLRTDARQSAEHGEGIDWPKDLPKELPLNMLPGGEVFIDLGRPIPEREELFESRPETTLNEPEELPPETRPERLVQPLPLDRQPVTVGAPRDVEVVPSAPPGSGVPVLPQAFERPADRPMVPVDEQPEQQPEPPRGHRRPAAGGGVTHRLPRTVPVGEAAASKRDVENAVYRAAKTANHSGLVTGILVGGIYEHFKHKRRERRVEKRFKQQTRQLRQSREDQRFAAVEHAKRQAESERKFSSAEQRFAVTERASADREERTEKRFATLRQIIAKPQKTLERANSEVPERLTVPSAHLLKTSEWLSTEVDKRTGLPVKPEQRTFAYGREYHRERTHETASAARRTAAAGEVALKGASATQAQRTAAGPSSTAATAQRHTPDATASGSSSTHRFKGLSDLKLRSVTTAAGPIWPYVLTLVVIFICLVVLIH